VNEFRDMFFNSSVAKKLIVSYLLIHFPDTGSECRTKSTFVPPPVLSDDVDNIS
jgi:hypothetical protein